MPPLPPKKFRPCATLFGNDEFYLNSAAEEAQRLVDKCGLTDESRLLDVGCATGRLAFGILQQCPDWAGSYLGMDVQKRFMDWTGEAFQGLSNYRFRWLDVESPRYYPRGKIQLDEDFRFDLPDQSFDIIYLYSVITHLPRKHAVTYLNEFQRLLAPGGTLFFTACLNHRLPEEIKIEPDARNNACYRVTYRTKVLEDMVLDAGLRIKGLDYQTEYLPKKRQSGVYATCPT
jgi:ubiquinone/menaquinone biosynthesis C-methylase UbiE